MRQLGTFIHGGDVDDNAVANDIHTAGIKDAAGEKMESILDAPDDDRVPSISSAVETSAIVIFFCQNVHEFALSFVAPLGSYDRSEFAFKACDTTLDHLINKKIFLKNY